MAITAAGTVTAKVYVGGAAVVIDTETTPGTHAIATRYLLKDHLGSTDVVTDEAGAVLERLSFDAWGRRREVGWKAYVAPQDYAWQGKPITRGFTGHEQLDPVGLVHMNGRVYDAELGRFLSPDIVIQDASNLQALNAYTYVLNNPLSLTDPTGYFFSGLFRAIGNAFRSVFRAVGSAFKAVLKSTIGRAVIQIAVCALDPIAACAAVAAGLTAAAGGSVVDAIKAAAFSLVQFGVWTEVGFFVREVGIGNILAKGALHGVVGGALAVAQGGSFLHGFASNAIGAATGIVSGYANNEILDTELVATTGGFAAMITGGKFANGAITAAFANLYNKWQATFTQWGTLGGFGAGAVLGAGAASGTCISATAGGCLLASPYVAAQGGAVGGFYGGAVGGWLGSTIGGWIDGIIGTVDVVYNSSPGPKDPPPGTRPIDKWGIGKDPVHEIKDQIGAGASDWVGITPGGYVITVGPKGEAIETGHVDDFTNKPLRQFPRP